MVPPPERLEPTFGWDANVAELRPRPHLPDYYPLDSRLISDESPEVISKDDDLFFGNRPGPAQEDGFIGMLSSIETPASSQPLGM